MSSCDIKQQTAISNFIDTLNDAPETPYVNSVYYDRIEPLFRRYQSTVSADSQRTEDRELLNQVTAQINQFFTSEVQINQNFTSLYPYLSDRISSIAFITPAEVQTVISNSFLTYETIEPFLTPYSPTLSTLFNEYYSPGTFSGSGMKSFCSLVPNIFAAYTNLMNKFNDIKALANTFNNILSAVQEFSLAGLLEGLKQQALSIIDGIVAKVRAKINEITGLFTRIANFKINTGNIYSKMNAEKQKLDEVLAEPSIDNLKKSVEGAISFAASLFEELKLEEIQFIILRFCELISGIENFFDDLVRPIQEIPDNYRRSFEFLRSASFSGTARAISAGAFRIPSDQRMVNAETIDNLPATVVGGDGVSFGDEGFTVSGGIAVRQRSYRIAPITDEEVAILNNELTFENVSQGRSSNIKLLLGQSYSIDGPKIWTNVRPLEKIMLYRLSQRLGRLLTVNSAYRSSRAQANITGKDRASWHISGQAFDVRSSSFSGISFGEFKSIANSIGFSRVRPYPSDGFVHIDTGPPSSMW